MVKFFTNKEGKLDMFKAISAIIISSGIIILCLTMSIDAKIDSKEAKLMVGNQEKDIKEIKEDVKMLLKLHTGKKGE